MTRGSLYPTFPLSFFFFLCVCRAYLLDMNKWSGMVAETAKSPSNEGSRKNCSLENNRVNRPQNQQVTAPVSLFRVSRRRDELSRNNLSLTRYPATSLPASSVGKLGQTNSLSAGGLATDSVCENETSLLNVCVIAGH